MNENATITAMFDLDGKSAAELLRLDAMLSQEDGNDEACDMIHDYIDAHARALYERAVAAGDIEAGAILEEVLEYADPEYYAELCDQAEAEEAEAEEDARTGKEMYLDMLVQAFFDKPENSNLAASLGANAQDIRAYPDNLYRAGVFCGLAEAAAWVIYKDSEVDDIRGIQGAIYDAYQVAF